MAETVVEKVPMAHAMHVVAPDAVEYDPAGHAMHCAEDETDMAGE